MSSEGTESFIITKVSTLEIFFFLQYLPHKHFICLYDYLPEAVFLLVLAR